MDKIENLAEGAGGGQQQGGGGGGGAGGMEDKVLDQGMCVCLHRYMVSPCNTKRARELQQYRIILTTNIGVDQAAGDMGVPAAADGAINKEVDQEAGKLL